MGSMLPLIFSYLLALNAIDQNEVFALFAFGHFALHFPEPVSEGCTGRGAHLGAAAIAVI